MRRYWMTIVVGVATAFGAGSAAGDEAWGPIDVLGRQVDPGTKARFPFIEDRSFEASYLDTFVFVAHGIAEGPTLCVTAGVHGDELNGVEIARRAFSSVDATAMHGTLIALPAINAQGVRTGNRYLSDRRDLNRSFPGREGGSVAALIANAVFVKVLGRCDAVVDLHTASNNRANLPQIRADLSVPQIEELAIHFGLGIVVAGAGPDGSLRREAAKAGIPAIIYEAGEPYRFQSQEIDRGVRGVLNVMAYMDLTDAEDLVIPDTRVYERTRWVRAAVGKGGFFFPSAGLGDSVETGDVLGTIVDPLTDEEHEVIAPRSGEIVGMSVSQPVLSGYALFHLAWHDE